MTEQWVGERQRVRNRQTGTLVVLVDGLAEPRWLDTDGGRWSTVCDAHSSVVAHDKLANARAFLHHPEDWCDDCQALVG